MLIAMAMVLGMGMVMVIGLVYLAFEGSRRIASLQEQLGIAEAIQSSMQDRINRERDTHRIVHADLNRDLQDTRQRANRLGELEHRLVSIAEEHEKLTVAFSDVKSRVGALQMSKR